MDERPPPETCCATVWLWPGHAAYLGPSLRLDAHSGSVHCFALGVDDAFTVHAARIERRVRSAFVPARTRHRVVAGDGRMLFFYLDPSSTRTDEFLARMTDRTQSIAYHHRDELTIIGQATSSEPEQLRHLLLGDAPDIDDRIRVAMRTMRTSPVSAVSAAELAAEVNLSMSRFLHLFSANAGTSFRRYRLWTRMLQVAVGVNKGMDLTRAATAAGFSSSNHFSDAFHAMFGLTASALLAGGTRIVVSDA